MGLIKEYTECFGLDNGEPTATGLFFLLAVGVVVAVMIGFLAAKIIGVAVGAIIDSLFGP